MTTTPTKTILTGKRDGISKSNIAVTNVEKVPNMSIFPIVFNILTPVLMS